MKTYEVRIPVDVYAKGEAHVKLCGHEMVVEVYARDAEHAVERLAEQMKIRPPVQRPPATPPRPLRGPCLTPGCVGLERHDGDCGSER